MSKVKTVWEAVKKLDKYCGPDNITFFEMDQYTFILHTDVINLAKEKLDWVHKDTGTIDAYKAIRLPKFDPHDIDNYFDDLLYRGYSPIRVKVKPAHWLEDAYVQNQN